MQQFVPHSCLSLLLFQVASYYSWSYLEDASETRCPLSDSHGALLHLRTPKGDRGWLMSSPPVWSLWAVIWLHFTIFSLVLLPSPLIPSVLSFFLPAGSFPWTFSRKFFQYFSLRDRLFLYGSSLAARRSNLVGGMCSVLPYGTGICCYAFIRKKLLLLSIPSFFFF